MDGRPGRGGEDVREECPGNKADPLGWNREHRTGATHLRGEVLGRQTRSADGEAVGSHWPLLITVEMSWEE